MYDIDFILQVNHIFMEIFSLNKESDDFSTVSFQMIKLPQSLHALHFLYHFVLLVYLEIIIIFNNLKNNNDIV